jgi:hypothetical protein
VAGIVNSVCCMSALSGSVRGQLPRSSPLDERPSKILRPRRNRGITWASKDFPAFRL